MSSNTHATIYHDSNLEDEQEYIVQFEILNLQSIINNIYVRPRSDSPIYQHIIIPQVKKLIETLEKLDVTIGEEIEKKSNKSINDLLCSE